MKILKHILSTVIWSVIVLYTSLMTLIHLPFIQEKLANKVSTELSRKFGTKVFVGRIDLGFLNRIIIDDVSLLDQQQKEMLRANRLSVKVEWSPLAQGRIVISSAQLFGVHADLYKADEQTPLNCQFLIDSLASKDTTSHTPLDLRINSLIIRHSSISYDQKNAPKLKQFNTKHLKINDISAHVILKSLTDDSLNINVKRLAFKERCGFQLNTLAFKLSMGQHGALLNGFNLQLPQTSLTIDTVAATYDAQRWKETLNYHTSSIACRLALSDLSCFVPSFQKLSDLIELTTMADGTSTSLNIPRFIVSSKENQIAIKAIGKLADLDKATPSWEANITDFTVTPDAFKTLKDEIEGIPDFITNLGKVSLQGFFLSRSNGEMRANSNIKTDIGSLSLGAFRDANMVINGQIRTEGIDLQTLLDNKALGKVAAKIDFAGDKKKFNITGIVPLLELNRYSYRNIELNTLLTSDDLLHNGTRQIAATGNLRIDDEHVRLNLKGDWHKSGKKMTLRAEGNINDFSPKALNLSSKWGNSVFNASLDANVSASNLNDAQGDVYLNNFVMTDTTDVFAIKSVHVSSGYEDSKHYLRLDGDMGNIELNGEFDWNTLPQSFTNAIGSKLPTLPGLPKLNENITNNFDIKLQLVSTQWLQKLFYVPLDIEKPLTLYASVNDLTRQLSARGSIDAFTYGDAAYKNASIMLSSPTDSIKCDISLQKQMGDGTSMDVQLEANASDNQLQTSFSWDNHAKGIDYMKGKLNTSTQLYADEKGKPEAHIHIQPSNATIGGVNWSVMPSDVFYNDKNLVFDGFSVNHEQQHLTVNGTASASPSDTLTVELKEINVGDILDIVNFHSVEFEGLATGKAFVTQLFGTPVAWTDLNVKQFKFEGGLMGTLHAQAQWNNTLKQIDIDAHIEDGPDVQTTVKGYVSPVREDIELDIHGMGTHIDFLQTYTSGILKDISGNAYGKLKLVGPLGGMDLLGRLVVDGRATVIALGTTYTLQKDTVEFVRDDILLNKAIIHDKFNNTATVSGGIHHKNLSNLTFDLDFETNKLLAYDFKDFGNEIFCGNVVTAGKVDMHGRTGEVVINCNATPLSPTTFLYNASSSGSVSSQEYVTWRDKTKLESDSTGTLAVNNAKMSSDLFINFLINTTPEATVRLLMDDKTNDYITLNGSGTIRAVFHNKGAFQMFGTYRISKGTYGLTIQNIIKKNFTFNEGGTIVFGGNPMNANLNLQAMHTVNGVSLSDLNIGNSFSSNLVRVNCLMNILGQAGSPRVEFDLDLPNVNSEEKQMIRSIITSDQEMNQQVLYLLGIGRFYTQGINNAASSQSYDQTQLAMQSFLSGTLSSQINEVISQVVKNDNWNFGANISTGNEGWRNAEYEGTISGRMLNNRLLINGQFGYRDNAKNATPSFIGDFDIRYLLQPNGNLALKVYNQTNDRYFTRSSLNTQGIGIIIKRDFDGLGELFFRRKKK